MDNTQGVYRIKPIVVDITSKQKELIVPIALLKRSVQKQSIEFSQRIQTLHHLLQYPEKEKGTVLSYGLNLIQSLHKTLVLWEEQYKEAALKFIPLCNRLAQLKVSDITESGELQSDFMLEQERSQQAHEKQYPSPLCYEISVMFSQLEWALCKEWNQCLGYIDFYNKNQLKHQSFNSVPSLEPMKIYSFKENEHVNASTNPALLIKNLQEKLTQYACIFKVSHLETTQAFEKLKAMNNHLYEKSYTAIGKLLGAHIKDYKTLCNSISIELSNNINGCMELAQKGWESVLFKKEKVIGSVNDINLFLSQEKTPFINFKKIRRKKIGALFPQNSLLGTLERLLLKCFYDMDCELRTIMHQYTSAIYAWHHARLMQDLELTDLQASQDVFSEQMVKFKKKLDSLSQSLAQDFTQVLSTVSPEKLQMTVQEAMLRKEIELARFESRKYYQFIAETFNSFAKQSDKGTTNLQDGQTMIKKIEENPYFFKIYQNSHNIVNTLGRISVSLEKKNRLYRVCETIPSKELLIEKKPEIEAKQHFSFEKAPNYVFQKNIISVLLHLIGSCDHLFYLYMHWIKETESIVNIAVEGPHQHTMQVLKSQVEQYKRIILSLKVPLQHYKSLFIMHYAHHQTAEQRLAQWKALAYNHWQRINSTTKQSFSNVQDFCRFLSHVIHGLRCFLDVSDNRLMSYKPTLEKVSHNQTNHFQPVIFFNIERLYSFEEAKEIALNIWEQVMQALEHLSTGFLVLVMQENVQKEIQGTTLNIDSVKKMLDERFLGIKYFINRELEKLTVTQNYFNQKTQQTNKNSNISSVLLPYQSFLNHLEGNHNNFLLNTVSSSAQEKTTFNAATSAKLG